MVFWKSVPALYRVKMEHVKKIGGRTYSGFIYDYGDVPAGRYNEITCKVESVVNPRGNAYATRKRLSHRKGYKRNKKAVNFLLTE